MVEFRRASNNETGLHINTFTERPFNRLKRKDIWTIGVIFDEIYIAPKDMSDDILDIRTRVDRGHLLSLPRRFSEADNKWLNKMVTKNPDDRMTSGQVYGEARGKPF
ncbi:hypothetical protein WR25_12664 [Diploscapter pachys]|uniref:Protein kinase domain-containing protein n=1 Tax=Diploscapter pachys TaxID=2018661 RepID=A0A2A2KQJ3_9BILA|nr:hypothetical protein WR25_12664 [Diploscapter pachys]